MSSPSTSKTLEDITALPLEISYNSPPSQLLMSASAPVVSAEETLEDITALPLEISYNSPPSQLLMSASAPVVSAEAPVAALPAPMSPPLSVWKLVGMIVGIEIVVLILVPLLATLAPKLTGMIVGIGIGIGIVVVVVLVGIFKYKNRKWKTVQERLRMENINGHSHAPPQDSSTESIMDPESTERPDPPPSPGIALGYSLRTFSCEELERATDGFSNVNLLGRGGFGNVYKGVLPVPDEKVIAVKQRKSGSDQGEREFLTEVEVISRVHHKNLVSLVGYCNDGDQRMLVYEFVPNKTLYFHLHGEGSQPMDWPTRMKIALGSAEGLAYLHEGCQPKIIHRDIKPTNILLDYNFVAKVADFGLAKSSSETDTHVSTLGRGTYGYMDMEYANSKKLTEKSDVFSFGVVLLELITGKKPLDESRSSVELAEALEKGNFDELVDPRLQNDYDSSAMTRMVACAAACVRQSGRRRPRMSQIIQALKGNISPDALDKDIPPENS